MQAIIEGTCPYCGSASASKKGFLKDGTRKYQCTECNKYFSSKTVVREKLDKECPECHSKNIKRCGTSNGRQRYLCGDCKKKFSDPYTKDPKVYVVECPQCGCAEAKLGGHSPSGEQYYKCKKCDHKFLVNGNFRQLTNDQKEEIRELWKEGHQMPELMKVFSKSERTIRNLIRPIKKEFQERHLFRASNMLSTKEKQTILMYGLGARVSPSDLAKHLKMETALVDYVLRKYADRIMEKANGKRR